LEAPIPYRRKYGHVTDGRGKLTQSCRSFRTSRITSSVCCEDDITSSRHHARRRQRNDGERTDDTRTISATGTGDAQASASRPSWKASSGTIDPEDDEKSWMNICKVEGKHAGISAEREKAIH